AATTIAYGVIELYVKLDGQFEFCLLRGKQGGFENKKRIDSVYLDPLVFREFAFIDMPDAAHGISSQDGPLSVLKQATLLLERNFHPFAELPEPQQTALSDIFQAVLFDDELLMVLEPVKDILGRSSSLTLSCTNGESHTSCQPSSHPDSVSSLS
ncbi:DFNA5 isoform 11, partial [Pan troglodytes]